MVGELLNDQLMGLYKLMHQFNTSDYTFKSAVFWNNSVGQHVSYIVGLVQCLLQGYDEGCVNYDTVKSNFKLETDRHFAITSIEAIIFNIDLHDKHLLVIHENNLIKSENSSFYRELSFVTEHAILRIKLIHKILKELNHEMVHEQFDVTPATVSY